MKVQKTPPSGQSGSARMTSSRYLSGSMPCKRQEATRLKMAAALSAWEFLP